MGAAWSMVKKDLLRKLRQPLGVILLLIFPLIFSAMLALAFGSGSDSGMPRITLLVENRDDGLVSGFLVSSLGSEQLAEYLDVEIVGEEGAARMEDGEASALLRIPDGFSRNLLEGRETTLELVRNPAQSILPEITEQGVVILADGLSAASRVLRGPLDQLVPMLSDDAGPIDTEIAAIAVAVNQAINRADTFLFPPAITLSSSTLADPESEDSSASSSTIMMIFLMILPGISVFALFSLGDIAMRDLLVELEARTLQRQLAGPVGTGTVILAKAAFTAVLSLISLVILASVGWFATSEPVDLLGFTALGLALIFAITGASAAIYGTATSQTAGSTIGSIAYLLMGFSSGSFIPLNNLPASFRQIAPFTPFYWATQGFQDLLRDGAGLFDLLPNIAILAGTGLVLMALGSALLRRTVTRGAA
jgi:ABC-2 type transport system permease protein